MKHKVLSLLSLISLLWGSYYIGIEILHIATVYGTSHWYDFPYIFTIVAIAILVIGYIVRAFSHELRIDQHE